MTFLRFGAFSIACLACSADHVVHTSDAGANDGVDSGAVESDAGGADAGNDAGPDIDCFAEPLLIATTSSRFVVDTLVPIDEGWLVGAFSTSTGDHYLLVDREGRASDRPAVSFGSERVFRMGRMGGSFARVGYNSVTRVEHEAPSSGFESWRVAWGSILGASVDGVGTLRVVSYDPEVYVSDLRIHITEFTLDDREPTGFIIRDGTLPYALTERLGQHFEYDSYFIRGDSLRIAGPVDEGGEDFQSFLVTLDTSAIGSGAPLGFRIDEAASWEETVFAFHFAGLTNEWDRMLSMRRGPATDSYDAVVEPLPGRVSSSGAPTGNLGPGTPRALDTVIAVTSESEVRLYDALDLSPRGSATLDGTFESLAQSGDAVAILYRHEQAGEGALSLRCLAITR